MANQIVISSGAKVRNLNGVLTGTTGVVNSLGINVANGIPQLDGSGKILVSQLPNSVMEYKGTWNAATNTPTLVNGTGNQGDVYLCNVAGTVNFGAGAITFAVGDQAIYSGTIWQKAGGSTGTVTSVAVTETGDALTITGSPITTSGTINIGFAGISGQYVNGAGGLTTFPSLAGYVTAVTGTAPVVSSGGTTPAISMPVATASVDGYLDNADWTIFNNKQNAITLTTTGTSGAATLVGATLNIPNYSTALSGYVPYTGATQDVDLGAFKLNAQSLHVKGTAGNGHLGLKHQSASATASANEVSLFADSLGDLSWLNGNLYLSKFIISGNTAARSYTFPNANGTVALTSDLSNYVPYTGATANLNLGTFGITSGGIASGGIAVSHSSGVSSSSGSTTINGDANGIKINPVTASSNFLSFPASGSRTYTYPNATGTLALTSDIPSLSGYIQGSGTTNYVPKFTASGTIGNSLIYDTGTRIAIGGTSATYGVLTVQSDSGQFCIQSNTTPGKQLQIGYDHVSNNSYLTSLNQGVAFTPLALQPNGGNVGIGTSSPTKLLSIGTSAGVPTNGFNILYGTDEVASFTSNAGTGEVRIGATNVIGTFFTTFYSNNAERMRITTGGAIGMNTSSPITSSVLTLKETSGISSALNIINRNSTQTWNISVDALAVDDKYLGFIDVTNSAVRMVIGSNGNVGIGTSIPNRQLEVMSTDGAILRLSRNDGSVTTDESLGTLEFHTNDGDGPHVAAYVRGLGADLPGQNFGRFGALAFGVSKTANQDAVEAMRIDLSGNVCVNRTSGSGKFNIDGAFYMYNMTAGAGLSTLKYHTGTGEVTYDTSARIFKKDIVDLEYGLDSVLKMNPKKYKWKSNNEQDLGFIADEMHQVIPEIVFLADNKVNKTELQDGEPMGINYDRLVPVLVKAIQELNERIKQLENK